MRHSLSIKINVIIVLVVTTILSIFGVYELLQTRYKIENELNLSLDIVSERAANALGIPVWVHVSVALSNARLFEQISQANAEINALNTRLQDENLRLAAELDVTRQLQMLLPTAEELRQVEGLDIAGFMEPADEVGGDYYDVLQHNGRLKIGIGDVTGHGLESGVVMLMIQTAVRTLLTCDERDPVRFLDVLNHMLHDNM